MEKIYDEYFYKVFNWALKKTHSKEDAEDLTNNVFLGIFEYLNKNIEVEKLDNLIWKIAYNLWCTKAKEYIKDNNNLNTNVDIERLNSNYVIEQSIYNEIIEDIDNFEFTDNEKKSFKLYYFDGFSVKEISNKLNTKESNIKYYLYSARKKIKEKYYE